MRISLLLVVAICFSSLVYAQKRDLSNVAKADTRSVHKHLPDAGLSGSGEIDFPELIQSGELKSGKSLMKYDIFTSGNAYGLVNYASRHVSVHTDLNMVVFGSRAGGPSGLTSNDMKVAYSFDHGETSDMVEIIAPADHGIRYPSAIIHNPSGNTDPANMFAIVSGPHVFPIGTWGGHFYGSIRLDGQHDNVVFEPQDPSLLYNFMTINLTESVNGRFHVISDRLEGTDASWVYVGAEILNGTFNSSTNQVDWELPRPLLQPSLKPDDYYWGGVNMAYSPDGSVGYIVGMGVDQDPQYSIYGLKWPMVYKTTDSGLTWTKTAAFDFSTLAAFDEVIWPTSADTTVFVPQFFHGYTLAQSDYGISVDHNNNLHLFIHAHGAASIHPDSAGYYYPNEPSNLFHMIMDYNNEQWLASYITTLVTSKVSAGTYGYNWDHRMQMARTDDGTKVFFVWNDTDFGTFTEVSNPDIYVCGYDAQIAKYTEVFNKTFGTDYWLENYFMNLTDIVIKDGMTYHIPMVTSVLGTTDLDPLTNQFFKGISLNEGDFIVTNTKELRSSSESLFTASQNYPNPVRGTTQFVLDLNIASSVSIEIFNLMGQQLQALNYERMNAGRHIMQLDLSGYSSGVYFYTIKVAGQMETRKLVVE